MDRLTKLIKKLVGLYKTSTSNPAPKDISIRSQGNKLLIELNEYSNKSIRAGVAQLIYFDCVCTDIISITNLIIDLNRTLKEKSTLSASKCYFTEVKINVSSFFEKDGRYINSSRITDYCNAAKEFYTLTEACETATVGVDEHNYRMLTKFFVSLKNVNTSLLEVLKYRDGE